MLTIHSGQEAPEQRTLLESYVFDVAYPDAAEVQMTLSKLGEQAFSQATIKVRHRRRRQRRQLRRARARCLTLLRAARRHHPPARPPAARRTRRCA